MARWREKTRSKRVFEPQLGLVIIVFFFFCDVLSVGDAVARLRKQTLREGTSARAV